MKLVINTLILLLFIFNTPVFAESWHADYIKDKCAECADCCYMGKVKRVSFSKFDVALLEVARTRCFNARPKNVDMDLLKDILSVEKRLKIPEGYRGAILAAACRESGYNRAPRNGDGGKAAGLLQLHPWWKKRFKVNRYDPVAASIVWLSQILRSVPKARRKCGKRLAFVSAWAWVASGPKGWKCRSPRHARTLRRWHRLVKKVLVAKKT
jgi:hypothetical protein